MESILRIPDYLVVTEQDREWVAPLGELDGTATENDVQVQVSITMTNTLKVELTASETPLCHLKLRWNFRKPLEGSAQVMGDAIERGYGNLAWRGLEPYRALPWYFLMEESRGDFNTMTGCGVKVRPGAMCFWQLDPMGLTLWMDVRNGGSGVLLGGRTLSVCEVVFRMYSNVSPYAFGRSFCKDLCPDPIFPDHPVYGSNNWYYAYGHSTREEILADTDYLIKLTEGLKNRPYMVIDDCWQKERCDEYIGGPWVPNDKFGDMKTLAEEIKEKGAKPGIWVRFLLDKSGSIPDSWRLHGPSARFGPSASMNKVPNISGNLFSDFLDPSHPEVLAHVQEDIDRICGWGYTLIKHDFSTFDIFGKWGFQMDPSCTEDGWHFYDTSRTTAEIIVDFYKAIYETASQYGALIIGCNTIGHLGAGLMQISRTGDDTSGKEWERSWRMGCNTLAFRQIQHRIFFDCDADCVGITDKIPWKYNRYWAGLLANSGTVFFASMKQGCLEEDEEAELKEFFATASEQKYVAEPVDWQTTNMPQHWRTPTENPGQVKDLFFNWYEETGVRHPKELP